MSSFASLTLQGNLTFEAGGYCEITVTPATSFAGPEPEVGNLYTISPDIAKDAEHIVMRYVLEDKTLIVLLTRQPSDAFTWLVKVVQPERVDDDPNGRF